MVLHPGRKAIEVDTMSTVGDSISEMRCVESVIVWLRKSWSFEVSSIDGWVKVEVVSSGWKQF